jgi:hypothetical protein
LSVVPAGVRAFRATVETLLRERVSLVADATLYIGTSEPDVADLLGLCDAVNLHCETPDALARFRQRLEADSRRRGYDLDSLVEVAKRNLPYTGPPLDVGWDTILVDTSKGYMPPLEALVERCRPLVRRDVPVIEAPPMDTRDHPW